MADFGRRISAFDGIGAYVVAASVDSREDAEKMVTRHGLTFPVGYGLDAIETAAKLGSFYSEQPRFLHGAGFVLDPSGKVANAVCSNTMAGRLQPVDASWVIRYLSNPDAPMPDIAEIERTSAR